MMKQILFLIALSFLFTQCKNTEKTTKDARSDKAESQKMEEKKPIKTTNLIGQSYHGLLPCADCMGIETELTFKENGQYQVKSFYLGKSDEVNFKEGQYQLDGGKVICRINNKIVSRYQIKDNQLIPEGPQASSKGGIEELYVLRKNLSQLLDRYWVLTEVMGQEVKPLKNGKEAFLLARFDGSFSASGGCNSLFGNFSLSKKNFIEFKEIASSEMECVYDHYDKSLTEALERTQQIMLNKNGELVLVVGKAAPLARFKKMGL